MYRIHAQRKVFKKGNDSHDGDTMVVTRFGARARSALVVLVESAGVYLVIMTAYLITFSRGSNVTLIIVEAVSLSLFEWGWTDR